MFCDEEEFHVKMRVWRYAKLTWRKKAGVLESGRQAIDAFIYFGRGI